MFVLIVSGIELTMASLQGRGLCHRAKSPALCLLFLFYVPLNSGGHFRCLFLRSFLMDLLEMISWWFTCLFCVCALGRQRNYWPSTYVMEKWTGTPTWTSELEKPREQKRDTLGILGGGKKKVAVSRGTFHAKATREKFTKKTSSRQSPCSFLWQSTLKLALWWDRDQHLQLSQLNFGFLHENKSHEQQTYK